ncbi:hypothetical protein HYT24_00900 [Candidatus Pacearchaeota archaeon]|nr:hypothetical protein [Candidatus Pacearchaeota archaeon]
MNTVPTEGYDRIDSSYPKIDVVIVQTDSSNTCGVLIDYGKTNEQFTMGGGKIEEVCYAIANRIQHKRNNEGRNIPGLKNPCYKFSLRLNDSSTHKKPKEEETLRKEFKRRLEGIVA